jgi:nitronate monooxygenase
MSLPSLKIGKHVIKSPIIQGGMGVGISWDRLAGAVSAEGGLGVISSVGTGYYQNKELAKNLSFGRPFGADNFYSKEALFKIFENARKICNDAPLACNVLYAINDYGRVVRESCEAGADIIITGAGLPTNMPEFTEGFPDVALVPIVSSAKALKILNKRWEGRYKRIPDAIIVEGPLSGGHQGVGYEDCYKEEYQLENLIPAVIEEAKAWGNIPVIAAGGIWDYADIKKFMDMGAAGVQIGTRFIATHECDAPQNFKELLMGAKEEDIVLMKSPVGYPARGIKTELLRRVENKTAPEVKCISNCVIPCHQGVEAKAVGYCIADRLSDAALGNTESGLYFSGSNGYRVDEIISVKELMRKLAGDENS